MVYRPALENYASSITQVVQVISFINRQGSFRRILCVDHMFLLGGNLTCSVSFMNSAGANWDPPWA